MSEFLTYEVGSMPKLSLRVNGLKGNPITQDDISQVIHFSQMAGVDHVQIEDLLVEGKGKFQGNDRKRVIVFNALLNLRLQESVGLDRVYDGEGRRPEMYANVARHIVGFDPVSEMIMSRGYDSWQPRICVEKPVLIKDVQALPLCEEVSYVLEQAVSPIKVPIDDPTMIVNMSINEYYASLGLGEREMKREFTLALAKNIIRPQVALAVEAGADWVQLDCPAATIDPLYIDLFVQGINEVVRGFQDVKFSLHICYPKRISLTDKVGYELLFPEILSLDENVNHLHIELANGNRYETELAVFKQYQDQRRFEIGVGVIDITSNRQHEGYVESAQLVRDRILKAADILEDSSLVYVAPDCGMRQLTLERTIDLYKVMVEGAELARQE